MKRKISNVLYLIFLTLGMAGGGIMIVASGIPLIIAMGVLVALVNYLSLLIILQDFKPTASAVK